LSLRAHARSMRNHQTQSSSIVSSLAVHVSFYSRKCDRSRMLTLNNTLSCLQNIPWEVSIFVHTNSHCLDYKLLVNHLIYFKDISFIFHSLKDIDPWKLSWLTRPLMEIHSSKYDACAYIEDDICLSPEAFNCWLKHEPLCSKFGWNLGILRTEKYPNGSKCIVDFFEGSRLSTSDAVVLNASRFIKNKLNPYTAFWIYRKAQMKRFVLSPLWNPENIQGYGTPERVGIGMNGLHGRMFKGTLIPTVMSNKSTTELDPKCTVPHLSGGKYMRSESFCKTLLDHAVKQQPFFAE